MYLLKQSRNWRTITNGLISIASGIPILIFHIYFFIYFPYQIQPILKLSSQDNLREWFSVIQHCILCDPTLKNCNSVTNPEKEGNRKVNCKVNLIGEICFWLLINIWCVWKGSDLCSEFTVHIMKWKSNTFQDKSIQLIIFWNDKKQLHYQLYAYIYVYMCVYVCIEVYIYIYIY